jgi:hypothetical protein
MQQEKKFVGATDNQIHRSILIGETLASLLFSTLLAYFENFSKPAISVKLSVLCPTPDVSSLLVIGVSMARLSLCESLSI